MESDCVYREVLVRNIKGDMQLFLCIPPLSISFKENNFTSKEKYDSLDYFNFLYSDEGK